MENNPIDKQIGIVWNIKEKFPALQLYNLQKVPSYDLKA
jgi:hypothetical protein